MITIVQYKKKEKEVLDYENSFVKPFVSKQWTFEWCLLKSTVLGASFKAVLKKVHSTTFENCNNDEDWESGVAKLLLNKGLEKTEIAYQLSEKIKEFSSLDFKEDDTFYYIVDAIKHACKNGN